MSCVLCPGPGEDLLSWDTNKSIAKCSDARYGDRLLAVTFTCSPSSSQPQGQWCHIHPWPHGPRLAFRVPASYRDGGHLTWHHRPHLGPGRCVQSSVGAEADIGHECKMSSSTPQLLLPSDSPVRPGDSVTVVHALQKPLCTRTFRVSECLHFFPRPPQELRNETGQRIWFVLEIISLWLSFKAGVPGHPFFRQLGCFAPLPAVGSEDRGDKQLTDNERKAISQDLLRISQRTNPCLECKTSLFKLYDLYNKNKNSKSTSDCFYCCTNSLNKINFQKKKD